MKVKSESEFAQSCQTLSDPMDCGLPGASVHGIFQARVLKWGAIDGHIGKEKVGILKKEAGFDEVIFTIYVNNINFRSHEWK